MMPDREKVITALEFCTKTKPVETCIGECPYAVADDDYRCRDMKLDALALLKEQEAVEPTLIREGRNKYYSYYVCPRCGDEVVYDQNYCSECGVRFLWEGR